MKFLFYIVLILFLYRALFRPKVVVEHRHFYDDEKQNKKKPNKPKLGDFTDYEEVK
jgi:hypothetical protein